MPGVKNFYFLLYGELYDFNVTIIHNAHELEYKSDINWVLYRFIFTIVCICLPVTLWYAKFFWYVLSLYFSSFLCVVSTLSVPLLVSRISSNVGHLLVVVSAVSSLHLLWATLKLRFMSLISGLYFCRSCWCFKMLCELFKSSSKVPGVQKLLF